MCGELCLNSCTRDDVVNRLDANKGFIVWIIYNDEIGISCVVLDLLENLLIHHICNIRISNSTEYVYF